MKNEEINAEDFLKTAKRAAYSAVDVIKSSINNNELHLKSFEGKDIKLNLDLKIEEIIREILLESTDFPIMGEEMGLSNNKDSLYQWMIDPIDGTYNLSIEFPYFAVSIALMKGDKPVLGVVYHVSTDEMYQAVEGKGAYKNGERIRVGDKHDIRHASLATGFPLLYEFSADSKHTQLMRSCKKVRMIGCASLSLALVASGIFDMYYEENINIWDVAAGMIIVQEAGGQVVQEKTLNNSTLIIAASNKDVLGSVEHISRV